jgi:hypothetical protein
MGYVRSELAPDSLQPRYHGARVRSPGLSQERHLRVLMLGGIDGEPLIEVLYV